MTPDACYVIQGNMVDRNTNQNGCGYMVNASPTLNTQDKHAICYPETARNQCARSDSGKNITFKERAGCPGGGKGLMSNDKGYSYTITPNDTQAVCYDARGNGDGMTAPTLTGEHQRSISDYTALCIGNGQLNQMSMAEQSNTLDCMYDQQAILTTGRTPRKYVVRRLTPLECCRLQGFPDWWEDGVEGSDSARYKMWGNGIALPCAADVLNRIAKEVEREGKV